MKRTIQTIEEIVEPKDVLGLEMSKLKGGLILINCRVGTIDGNGNLDCNSGKIQ